MPEMDGLMLASEIRRDRDARTLPLIMLTSLGGRDSVPEADLEAARSAREEASIEWRGDR